jgi:hypothetical protein
VRVRGGKVGETKRRVGGEVGYDGVRDTPVDCVLTA